jgi:serine/threonine-protein kinase RsbW
LRRSIGPLPSLPDPSQEGEAGSANWRAFTHRAELGPAPSPARRSGQLTMGTQGDQGVLRRRLSLPSSTERLPPLRALLRRLLQDRGIAEPIIHDVVLATHEATVNAMVHGNGLDAARRVRLEVRMSQMRVVVRVQDEGHGFDWREWLQRRREQPPPPDALRGRGLVVMTALMDDVAFNDAGNVVRMARALGDRTWDNQA